MWVLVDWVLCRRWSWLCFGMLAENHLVLVWASKWTWSSYVGRRLRVLDLLNKFTWFLDWGWKLTCFLCAGWKCYAFGVVFMRADKIDLDLLCRPIIAWFTSEHRNWLGFRVGSQNGLDLTVGGRTWHVEMYVSNFFGYDWLRVCADGPNWFGFCGWAGTPLVVMSLRIELDFLLVLVVHMILVWAVDLYLLRCRHDIDLVVV